MDMEYGIDRLEHPDKGLLQSRKDKFNYSPDEEKRKTTHLVARTPRQYRQYCNKRGTNDTKSIVPTSETHTEQNVAYKDIQLPTKIELENISFESDITTQFTRDHEQQTGRQNQKKEITLNDMPNEVMAIIWSYLTFTEKSRIGRTNNRMRALSEMPEFWRLVRIPHQVLSYTLISNIITMGTKRLSIPWCSIRGNWSGYSDLENILTEGLSNLEYLDMTGCNGSGTYDGNDSMAAILVSRSESLTVLDLSTS
jgi:hypothetical protein